MEQAFPCIFTLLFFFSTTCLSSPSRLHPSVVASVFEHRNSTAISDFRVINRRTLLQCPDPNPFLQINVSKNSSLVSNEEMVSVTVSGVLLPLPNDWIAMISPSDSNTRDCPGSKSFYVQTGDISDLPLLCHYPVKAIYASSDPAYLSCQKKKCRKYNENGRCEIRTCSATVTFHVINIRTDIEFVFFAGGFLTPCILRRTLPFRFSNPNSPLHGHLSAFDSSGTSMRLTWISGDSKPQRVNYGNGKSQISQVTTFSQEDMCSSPFIPSPAKDFGWHDPGYIHTAVMTGLQPSSISNYKYGSDAIGWSDEIGFHTPPAGGSDELKFLVFGDMGKAPFDASIEHYIQPGSVSVVKAMEEEMNNGSINSIFHIGDISYATGFLVEWEFFLNLISPLASKVSYMTAIGNHERDYAGSGDRYLNADSGGECGVPYETYFPMPTAEKDKPWYAIEQGPVHFTVISTEHDWTQNSEQYQWMMTDMASVDRTKTPWLIFTGHRPMYSSTLGNVDDSFRNGVEPVLLANKVDLVLFGHVHNYERTCSISNSQCLAMPEKDENGVDTYDNGNYKAPVHAIVGMAGFSIQKFSPFVAGWSLIRISEYGYVRAHATRNELKLEFVNSTSRSVIDGFRITKS
ncbi:Detected protein of confused Function [Hibiscus syriacus]|uniref:Purple acid phosphatase n=1 Tax=Hibiscus syriacus TaxID=106335 RepID=A0A6A2Z6B0_HIBSY|nr:nucleotide pyrophosphatase/phosphodiesterase-like [Hibiscus syriacus]KAE8686655.1 Detected protein of confused Function [Hibiscus syriacus]